MRMWSPHQVPKYTKSVRKGIRNKRKRKKDTFQWNLSFSFLLIYAYRCCLNLCGMHHYILPCPTGWLYCCGQWMALLSDTIFHHPCSSNLNEKFEVQVFSQLYVVCLGVVVAKTMQWCLCDHPGNIRVHRTINSFIDGSTSCIHWSYQASTLLSFVETVRMLWLLGRSDDHSLETGRECLVLEPGSFW
jgi:hypothetical protein